MPVGVEDLVLRLKIWAGIIVAVETESHGETARLAHQRHRLDVTVAARASDTFGNMDSVVEIDIVGQIIDAMPDEWRVRCEAVPDRCQQSCIGPDLRVAGHAGIGRRQPGIGRRLTVV